MNANKITPCFKVIGEYGVILYGHENSTQLLATKKQAREIGSVLIDIAITEKQWAVVLRQIESSCLEESNPTLERLVLEFEGVARDPRPVGQVKIVKMGNGKKSH